MSMSRKKQSLDLDIAPPSGHLAESDPKENCHAALGRECAASVYPGCQEHAGTTVGLPSR